MEMRTTAPINKELSIGRVKPMLRGNAENANSSRNPANLAAAHYAPGNMAQRTPARRSAIAESEARYTGRSVQIEILRERIRRYLEQAASLRADRRVGDVPVQDIHESAEGEDDHMPNVFSRVLESRHSEIIIQNILQEVVSDVARKFREDLETQMRLSRNSNEQKLEVLTTRFEDVLRQKQFSHDQEVLELRGSIEYLQESLLATREESERLRQELDDANIKLIEKSEDMGSVQAELTDLRKEVQTLREYRNKHRIEMKNLDQLYKQLEDLQTINKLIRQEFTELEEERDELREEFEKNLLKLRMANKRRNHVLEEELHNVVDDVFLEV